MGDGNNSALDSAASDANQKLSSSPAGSPVQSCGSAPPIVVSEEKKHWIEIEMVDQEGKPAAGEDYRLTLPDGSIVEGSLDEKGRDRVNGIDPGTCKVTFPNLDKDSWQPK